MTFDDTFVIPKVTDALPGVGITWQNSTFTYYTNDWWDCCMNHDGSTFCAAEYQGRLWIWYTAALWRRLEPTGAVNVDWRTVCCDSTGDIILAAASTGHAYLTKNRGYSWTEIDPSGSTGTESWIKSAMSRNGLVMLIGEDTGRLWRSIDGGTTWAETRPMGDADGHWYHLAVSSDGKYQIAACWSHRLWTSSDTGATWTERQPDGASDRNWIRVAITDDGQTMWAAVNGRRVWKSVNAGVNWSVVNPKTVADYGWYGLSCSGDGKIVFAAIQPTGDSWLSLDSGTTWFASGSAAATGYGTCVSQDGRAIGMINFNGYIYYSYPIDSQKPLPIVYGTNANSSNPIWECPLIGGTATYFWYAYAGHPVMTVAGGNEITLYKDGTALAGAAYTFYPCFSWRDKTISLIQFTTTQGTSVISAQGSGKWNGVTGLENIGDIVEDFLAVECDMVATTGSNLLTAWTGVSGWTTFTTSGGDITSAVWNTGAAIGRSNSFLTAGKRYKVECICRRTSGAWSDLWVCDSSHNRLQDVGAVSGSATQAGIVTLYFRTITGADNLELTQSAAGTWAATSFTVYEMTELSIDQSALALVKQQSTSQGYKAAGVIKDDTVIWDKIVEMMSSFLGSAYIDGSNVLSLNLDLGVVSTSGLTIISKGDVTVTEARERLSNLINQVPANLSYNYLEGSFGQYTETDATIDVASQGIYGVRTPTAPYAFYWTRDISTVQKIQNILVAKLKDPLVEIEFVDNTLKHLDLDIGSYFAMTVDFLYDSIGSPLYNQIWKVISVKPDFSKGTITFRALQTPYYLLTGTARDTTNY